MKKSLLIPMSSSRPRPPLPRCRCLRFHRFGTTQALLLPHYTHRRRENFHDHTVYTARTLCYLRSLPSARGRVKSTRLHDLEKGVDVFGESCASFTIKKITTEDKGKWEGMFRHGYTVMTGLSFPTRSSIVVADGLVSGLDSRMWKSCAVFGLL